VSPLHQRLADYLTIRRAMGFKMERHEKLLAQFVDYLTVNGAGDDAHVNLPEPAH